MHDLVPITNTAVFLCSVDGRWGPWGAYTTCNKKCGGGTKSRRRSCIAPKNGGKPCAGVAVENMKCNTEACPGEK